MAILNKLFGGLKMSWPAVIIFAVCAGVYTGIMGSIPAVENTSLHDIAEGYEWWVIFAFVIATNCEKNWESALKTFVFFLISQPLVFAVEVLFGHITIDLAWYYYSSIWGPATIITLPGGFLAYYIKKQNALGATILGFGCTLELIHAIFYAGKAIMNPPYHAISALVSLAALFIFVFAIQKETKNRVIALVVCAVVLLVLLVLLALTNRMLISV